MIANKTIQELAQKYQTTELNIRREYFQHLFLSYFFQEPETEKIYFKGGTALHLIYKNPRFSEDLDFSSSLFRIEKVEGSIVNALSQIEHEGIRCEIAEAKKTSGGYLAVINFKSNGHTVPIQIEISTRQKTSKGFLVTVINDYLPPYTLMQLDERQLVQEKIQALLTRKKPRDFYDLYFLLRAGLMTPKERHTLRGALKALSQTKIPFEKELKYFLPKSHWLMIKNFPRALEAEIRKFL